MEKLTEREVFSYKVVEDKSDGVMRVAGIYQMGDVRNRNKRVYPRRIWEKTLAPSSDFMNRLQRRLVLGELDHPDDGKTHIRQVSHLITNLQMEDTYNPECPICKANGGPHSHVMGMEEVLGTPDGNILRELYRARVQLGTSSRGKGSVHGGTGDESLVGEDFQLVTFDHVLDPSTPGAYPKVVSECVVHAVEKLITPECGFSELLGYRDILANVAESGDADVRTAAGNLLDALDVRLVESGKPKSFYVPATPSSTGTSGYTGTSDSSPTKTIIQNESSEADMEITLANPEVRKLVDAAIEDYRQQITPKVDKLAEDLEIAKAEVQELTKKLDAAASIGDEMGVQLKNTKFQLEAYKETSAPRMYDEKHTLEEAFEAAKMLIEELHALLSEEREEHTAVRALLGETVTRIRRREVVDHVGSILTRLESAEHSQALRPLLLECETVEEVNRKFSQLSKVLVKEGTTTKPAPAKAPVSSSTSVSEGVATPPATRREPEAELPKGASDLREGSDQLIGATATSTGENSTVSEGVKLSRAISRHMLNG